MNSPFNGLLEPQKAKLIGLLEAHIYKFNKNEEILPTIKKENIICILISGSAQIIYIEYNGDEIVLENLESDSVFGTNISATNSDNYQIIAKDQCEVLVIDYNKLFIPKNIQYDYFNTFMCNLFDILNSRLKDKNDRIRVLEKKLIRDKLLEYFEIEYKKSHSRFIYLSFGLKDLADYLAINRSAMFRELKHLKDDKFIEVKNKRITLLYK